MEYIKVNFLKRRRREDVFILGSIPENKYISKDGQEKLHTKHRHETTDPERLTSIAKNHNNGFTDSYTDSIGAIRPLEQKLGNVYGRPVKAAIMPPYTPDRLVPSEHLRLR